MTMFGQIIIYMINMKMSYQLNSNPLGAGVMFRKQLLIDIGLYDEKMLINEDKDILIRCQKITKGYHLKLPLYKYFKHGKSMTSDQKKMNKYTNLLNKKT